ncbi:unnamed protein product [Allacma fusca]|uniref:Uncharacterized protein n=1 Tax=Allacma fusca TaxID=39272 RepID=A0A8J2KK40_9HEXA|nr:unnamed protein product [Allacma fusca]
MSSTSSRYCKKKGHHYPLRCLPKPNIAENEICCLPRNARIISHESKLFKNATNCYHKKGGASVPVCRTQKNQVFHNDSGPGPSKQHQQTDGRKSSADFEVWTGSVSYERWNQIASVDEVHNRATNEEKLFEDWDLCAPGECKREWDSDDDSDTIFVTDKAVQCILND